MKAVSAMLLFALLSGCSPAWAQESQKAQTGDLYRYEDTDGELHLVDRIDKVPVQYRESLDRVPRNPEITDLGNQVTEWLKNREPVALLNRLYVRWVYLTLPAGVALLILLLTFVLPLLVRSGVLRTSIVIGALFLFLVVHTVWTGPALQERARIFSRTLTANVPSALNSGPWIRYEARTLQVTRRPVPLNPVAFHQSILSLIPLHRDLLRP